jgi:cbb3-type cytochrome oxidase cytochrome c subunit
LSDWELHREVGEAFCAANIGGIHKVTRLYYVKLCRGYLILRRYTVLGIEGREIYAKKSVKEG